MGKTYENFNHTNQYWYNFCLVVYKHMMSWQRNHYASVCLRSLFETNKPKAAVGWFALRSPPEDRLPWPTLFTVFLSPSSQISDQHLKLGHCHFHIFFPNSLFTKNPSTWRYKARGLSNKRNKDAVAGQRCKVRAAIRMYKMEELKYARDEQAMHRKFW
jgi:hypothetical protein